MFFINFIVNINEEKKCGKGIAMVLLTIFNPREMIFSYVTIAGNAGSALPIMSNVV